ncbi:unnamed protein product [Chondrus crispus]|uniref:Uncharacterized protein n=1 Tax=Chondrus crispus TaxID=2769 RepID=R7Q7E1_CHOCR|nr:unnamed protein product [Chondrus crispus]CDF33385.1 unnamed protein product [Chondrus crispus]|eukprot:XP_005713188.1 unnamed protein product [Chondrus crispus]
MSVTGDNIRASFLRSGLWSLDRRRVLSDPRPESARSDAHAPILTVEDLAAFKERMAKIKDQILGADAVMTASGYVNTSNCCVVTAPQALALVRRKEKGNACKRRAKEIERLEVELARLIRRSQPVKKQSRNRHRHGQVVRSEQKVRRRSIVERRLVAKLRTLQAMPL